MITLVNRSRRRVQYVLSKACESDTLRGRVDNVTRFEQSRDGVRRPKPVRIYSPPSLSILAGGRAMHLPDAVAEVPVVARAIRLGVLRMIKQPAPSPAPTSGKTTKRRTRKKSTD